MNSAKNYLKQRAEENKLLKDFREVDKEKSGIIIDLTVEMPGVKVINGGKGFIFTYPTEEVFYEDCIKGNFEAYSSYLKDKIKTKIEEMSVSSKNKKDKVDFITEVYSTLFKKAIRLENSLNDFQYKNAQNILEKGQPNTFIVSEILEGKTNKIDYLRAPLIFREVEFKKESKKREVRISEKNGGKIIPNLHLFYEISALEEIEIEKLINELSFDKENYIDSIEIILKKLKVEFDWDLETVEFVNTSKNSGNLGIKFQNALNLFVDLERYRFLGLITEEINLSSLPIINNLQEDKRKSLIALTETIESIEELLNDEREWESDEEGVELIYNNIPEDTFEGDWKYEYKKINEEFNEFTNCNSTEELKETEVAQKFAEQMSLAKTISWSDYLEFVEDGVDLEFDANEEIVVKHKALIKSVRYLFKTEKLNSRKLTMDIKEVIDHGIIERIEEERFVEHNNEIPNESDIMWSFKSDYTQRMAVRKAVANNAHIIQGPPGTGKTQTILNIVAELIRQKKKVLIVSEKKTAVEVIAKRLKEGKINLFSTYLELYRDNDILEFVKELSKIVDQISEKPKLNNIAFESNGELLEEIEEFIDIADRLTMGDLDGIDKMIDSSISSNDIKSFHLWKKQGITSKESYNRIIEEIHNFENVDFLMKKNFLDEQFKNKLFNYEDISLTYLALNGKLNKPWWWSKNKLRKRAISDEVTKNFHSKLYNDLNVLNIDFSLVNKHIDFVSRKQEPNWNYFMLIEKNLESLKLVEKLYKSLKSNSLFEYSDFNDDDAFDENKKLSILSIWDKNKKLLESNPAFRRQLDDLRNRQKVTKIVRNFVKDNWDDLFNLFPIVIGTVENVSEYIPLKKEMFDYVIVDEASQIFVERALPSLYRAKNFIISGDKQQLRPYSGLNKISNETLKNEEVDYPSWIEHESLLDLFSELLGSENQSLLKVHYRSSTYELIKYSNDNFYDSKLSFVPMPKKEKIEPIKLVKVERDWKDQISYNEINEIIKIVNDLVSGGEKSIGIISMSKKQTSALRKEMLSKANEEVVGLMTSSTEEGIFIKPLNDVQGDERDYIIFSIGYDGKAARYAYINQSYGENRLNVAASRARKQMVVVMNGDPNNMAGRDLSNPGIVAFISFIDYVNNKSIDLDEENATDKHLLEYAESMGLKDYQILSDGKFSFISYEFNKAFFLIDKNMLKNTKNILWKYHDLLTSRGYEVSYDFPLENRILAIAESGILDKGVKLERKQTPPKQNKQIW